MNTFKLVPGVPKAGPVEKGLLRLFEGGKKTLKQKFAYVVRIYIHISAGRLKFQNVSRNVNFPFSLFFSTEFCEICFSFPRNFEEYSLFRYLIL